nr:RNA-directed DNA polymerase, eukaryota [Tanacetum cinerariifolium]
MSWSEYFQDFFHQDGNKANNESEFFQHEENEIRNESNYFSRNESKFETDIVRFPSIQIVSSVYVLMGSFRSKEDDVNRISTSVFVTNFPESFTAKDLFHTCKQHGHVVDSFIPTKRSKDGKRFGFVRFINVFSLDRLVSNLCTIWIGRLKIHANVARFHRTSAKGEYPHVKKANDVNTYGRKFSGENDKNKGRSFVNVLKGNKGTRSMETDSKHAIVLDDDCVQFKDLSQSLMGRVKEFASISNLMSAFNNEEDKCYHSKRLCIISKTGYNIFESLKIVFRGKVYWVRDKEVPGWVPEFVEDSNDSDEEDVQMEEDFGEGIQGEQHEDKSDGNNKSDEVPKTVFDESAGENRESSKDPFDIYPLLNKEKRNRADNDDEGESSIKYPSGFTPNVETNVSDSSKQNGNRININVDQNGDVEADLNGMDGLAQKAKNDWVKEMCVSHKINVLALQETEKESMNDSMGNSGGILCVCPNLFCKSSYTVSDSFVMVRGTWLKSGVNLLIICVYAPQELRDKRMLWDYLSNVANQWNGEVVMMGDFNEVRKKSERFGSSFNISAVDIFNSFIISAGVEEVPLGGSVYTWCHRSASKMSKLDRFLLSENLLRMCPYISVVTLDRYLSDHRPILLRESKFDYAPTPFRFFHHWLKVEGFNNLVIDMWNIAPGDVNNGMRNLIFKLKFLKSKIRDWCFGYRLKVKGESDRLKAELRKLDDCIDSGKGSEEAVKREFVQHFSTRFGQSTGSQIHIDMNFPKVLSADQQAELERPISKVELKTAVWDCGVNKTPDIPKGCNSSFIALISKSPDANMVKDF